MDIIPLKSTTLATMKVFAGDELGLLRGMYADVAYSIAESTRINCMGALHSHKAADECCR